MKKYFYIFIIAFVLNLVWENIHSIFYLNYKGGEITQFILARASLADTVFILIITFFAIRFFQKSAKRKMFIVIMGLFLSIFIERWAFVTGRWVYADSMPIIPLLNTGLTPTIQLAVLGFISFLIVEKTVKSPFKR